MTNDNAIDPAYLTKLHDAIQQMEGFIQNIQDHKKLITIDLYSDYSYAYKVEVIDDRGFTKTAPNRVVNNGCATPWIPKKGDRIPNDWVGFLGLPALDWDKIKVNRVSRSDIPAVLEGRKEVESKSPTFEGLVRSLTKQDLDILRDCFTAIEQSCNTLNPLKGAAIDGHDESSAMMQYISKNWSGKQSAQDYGTQVALLMDAFTDFQANLKDVVEGFIGLASALMAFIDAVCEVMKIREEDVKEAWKNWRDGVMAVIGIAVAPTDALAWISAGVVIVDQAGGKDSDERKKAMDKFREAGPVKEINEAKAEANSAKWPTFGEFTQVQKDFG